MRRVLAWPLAAVALIAVAAPALAQNGEPALVRVDEVREVPLSQNVPVIGRLVARQAGSVSARVEAPVRSYQVEVGDHVREGQLLAVLNDAILRARSAQAEAAKKQAEAALSTRQAELRLARQALARLEGLKSSAAFSQARYDDAQREVEIARARVEEAQSAIAAAQADLSLANIQLGYTRVEAPYDGVVMAKQSETGAYVRVGDPLVSLLSYTDLEIEVGVPYKRVAALASGQQLSFELADGTRHKAQVRAVLPEENPLTRTRRVRLVPQFDDTPGNLAAGQSATVYVPVGEERDVLSVHKDAIVQRRNADIVYIVQDGKATARPVRLGESVGERFEVLGGLQAGMQAVVRGNERLRDGQPVEIDTSGQLEPISGAEEPEEPKASGGERSRSSASATTGAS
ncbi:MAG: efflux RND transporter periplasmic adaptor subunit [Rhodovibrionaceae bacterium]|nr:efflux RND transporter periplasmic adaptor subunit [Rhodovibrionaceae bacterium]